MIAALCITIGTLLAQAPATPPEVPGLTQRLLGMPGKCPTALSQDARTNPVPLRALGQVVWALELAGQGAEAAKLAEFGLESLELDARAERPRGSVAPVVSGGGKATLPRCYVDAHAVSAVLEATCRHAAGLPKPAKRAWVERWWPNIEAGTEFVVGWSRGARGEPFPAFEPMLGRDSGGPREAMGALLGVACAQLLAEAAGKEIPTTWVQRRQALEILVRTTDFTLGERAPWGPTEMRGILPEDHPLWNAKLRDGGAIWTVRLLAWRDPGTGGLRWEEQPEQVIIALLAPRTPAIEALVQATVESWRERRAGNPAPAVSAPAL